MLTTSTPSIISDHSDSVNSEAYQRLKAELAALSVEYRREAEAQADAFFASHPRIFPRSIPSHPAMVQGYINILRAAKTLLADRH